VRGVPYGILGIDLGMTSSAVCSIDEEGRAVVLRNSNGEYKTPSAVYFESVKNIVVGREAHESGFIFRGQVVFQVKRVMGDPEYGRTFFGQEYTPQSISALILSALVKDAETLIGHRVIDVVITVPAYFGRSEREATRLAGEIAGLNVISLVPEPVAAALHYGISGRVGGATVLVYDLGGETFDVSLLKVIEGSVEVLAIGGDQRLGGADWDDKVLDYLVDQAIAQFGDESLRYDEQIMRDLRFAAEQIKKTLGTTESRKHNIRFDRRVASVTITRQQFEEITAELLSKTIQITAHTLADAEKIYPGIRQEISQVLLVGGSSLMPAVRNALVSEFGHIVELTDPELAVAKGAALYEAGPAVHRTETVVDAYRNIASGETGSSSPVDSYWDVRSKSSEDFGRALTKLKQDAGLTVQQVSVSAQIPVSLLSEYFSGHSIPPRSVLLRDILSLNPPAI
jgi:molecular chaperone DnaK